MWKGHFFIITFFVSSACQARDLEMSLSFDYWSAPLKRPACSFWPWLLFWGCPCIPIYPDMRPSLSWILPYKKESNGATNPVPKGRGPPGPGLWSSLYWEAYGGPLGLFHKPESCEVVQWENEFAPNYPLPFAVSKLCHLISESSQSWRPLGVWACMSIARHLQYCHLANDSLKTLARWAELEGMETLRG